MDSFLERMLNANAQCCYIFWAKAQQWEIKLKLRISVLGFRRYGIFCTDIIVVNPSCTRIAF